MQVDQALRALVQLKGAAPPTTAARLGEVIDLVQQLDEENATLSQQIVSAPPLFDMMPQTFEFLRPALHIVRAQSEALRDGKLGRITTEQVDCLKVINDHAVSSLRLIETLDTISLIQQGRLNIDLGSFSGLDLLAEAWQRQYEASEAREHHISIHADDPLPSIVGDHRYVVSILSDLLDNAIRYTPVGGNIRVTAETLGTHVLFSVADNGIGLSADDMEHIGEPFWRARQQTLVREHPGTGLRLYLAQQILRQHGSELLFSGEPSMGSTFSFALPVS